MLAIALGGALVGVGVAVGAYKMVSTEVVTCEGCGADIVDPERTTVCTVCDTPLFEEGEDYMQYGTGESSGSGSEMSGADTKTGTETERIKL